MTVTRLRRIKNCSSAIQSQNSRYTNRSLLSWSTLTRESHLRQRSSENISIQTCWQGQTSQLKKSNWRTCSLSVWKTCVKLPSMKRSSTQVIWYSSPSKYLREGITSRSRIVHKWPKLCLICIWASQSSTRQMRINRLVSNWSRAHHGLLTWSFSTTNSSWTTQSKSKNSSLHQCYSSFSSTWRPRTKTVTRSVSWPKCSSSSTRSTLTLKRIRITTCRSSHRTAWRLMSRISSMATRLFSKAKSSIAKLHKSN